LFVFSNCFVAFSDATTAACACVAESTFIQWIWIPGVAGTKAGLVLLLVKLRTLLDLSKPARLLFNLRKEGVLGTSGIVCGRPIQILLSKVLRQIWILEKVVDLWNSSWSYHAKSTEAEGKLTVSFLIWGQGFWITVSWHRMFEGALVVDVVVQVWTLADNAVLHLAEMAWLMHIRWHREVFFASLC
jgi:hypothetical protein